MKDKTHGAVCGQPGKNKRCGVDAQRPVEKVHSFVTTWVSTTDAGCKHNMTVKTLNGTQLPKPDAVSTLGFTDGLWWTLRDCWLDDR